MQVIKDFGELWYSFPEAQVFDSRYLAHFLPERDEN